MLKSRHVSLVNRLNTHSLSVTNQRWDKRVTEAGLRSRRGWCELVRKRKTLEREWVMLLEVSTTLNKSTEAGGSQVWKSTRCYTYVTEWWRTLSSRWDSVLFIKQPWQRFVCFLFSCAKKQISWKFALKSSPFILVHCNFSTNERTCCKIPHIN